MCCSCNEELLNSQSEGLRHEDATLALLVVQAPHIHMHMHIRAVIYTVFQSISYINTPFILKSATVASMVFKAASKVIAVLPKFCYHLCNRDTSSGRYIGFPVFPSRHEFVMEVQTASAPFPDVCSLYTPTGQAEMRPASVLICIYPADDPLLSLLCWRHKLHPS